MSDFHPVALYFIASETLGLWFWPLIVLTLLIVLGVIIGAVRLRLAERPARNSVRFALVSGLIVTAIAWFMVPGWSLADRAAYNGALDVAASILLALVPGVLAGGAAFWLASRRASKPARLAGT